LDLVKAALFGNEGSKAWKIGSKLSATGDFAHDAIINERYGDLSPVIWL